MGLSYQNLDERTRALMLAEIEQDTTEGTLYLSENLNQPGAKRLPESHSCSSANRKRRNISSSDWQPSQFP
jgi:hypothetical protein